jgi:nicotinamidase-related amidase
VNQSDKDREETMTKHDSVSVLRAAVVSAGLMAGLLATSSASAGNIIDDWASVKAPPPPALKEVTVDPATTALLMLDFVHSGCNEERRPRCVASLPIMKKLVGEARAAGATVIYSITPSTKPEDIWEDVAPMAGEPLVTSNSDKFLRTDLAKILADKGIKTVITVGTAAQGAILYTASEAALRGFAVIVPVDGISAEDTYFEQYVVYGLSKAPGIGSHVTLTSVDMMKF